MNAADAAGQGLTNVFGAGVSGKTEDLEIVVHDGLPLRRNLVSELPASRANPAWCLRRSRRGPPCCRTHHRAARRARGGPPPAAAEAGRRQPATAASAASWRENSRRSRNSDT